MKTFLSALVVCSAMVLVGCEQKPTNVAEGTTQTDIEAYHQMLAESDKGAEEGAKAAQEGGAE